MNAAATTDPPVEARRPLIKQYLVPLVWIQGLDATRLATLLEGIKLADGIGFNWREEWVDSYSADQVVRELIPAFRIEHGGRTAAEA